MITRYLTFDNLEITVTLQSRESLIQFMKDVYPRRKRGENYGMVAEETERRKSENTGTEEKREKESGDKEAKRD